MIKLVIKELKGLGIGEIRFLLQILGNGEDRKAVIKKGREFRAALSALKSRGFELYKAMSGTMRPCYAFVLGCQSIKKKIVRDTIKEVAEAKNIEIVKSGKGGLRWKRR